MRLPRKPELGSVPDRMRPDATRDRLLAQGYRFYADLDRELAEEGLLATRELWPEYDQTRS